MSLHAVITTIQPPTAAVRKLASAMRASAGKIWIIGDKKGPENYKVGGAVLLGLQRQGELALELPALLPTNHYTRKNIGYLAAIGAGATCIYETDDDNAPAKNWGPRESQVLAGLVCEKGWCNIYNHFSNGQIWPRGLPLKEIRQKKKGAGPEKKIWSPIQQGLVDGSPDVDAIWRLVLDRPFRFDARPSRALGSGVWCPFNSQSTWWWPEAYPLLYLPSHCTFRMTDIWRSLIAQRCIWAMGGVVTFHAPEAQQVRNEHDLLRDFEDEIPGYLKNEAIVRELKETKLKKGRKPAGENMLRCYERIISAGVIPKGELKLIQAWLADVEKVTAASKKPKRSISLPVAFSYGVGGKKKNRRMEEKTIRSWCQNLKDASKAQLQEACEGLGLNWSAAETRYQWAGGCDLARKEGIHFILTGRPWPGKSGYTWS